MCDASDYALGVVLGQKKDKIFHGIHYANKFLNETQVNYTTIEKKITSHSMHRKNLGHIWLTQRY